MCERVWLTDRWTKAPSKDFTGNIAFDLFTGDSASDTGFKYEVMIWVQRVGAYPLHDLGDRIKRFTDSRGNAYQLCVGTSKWTTFSFLADASLTAFTTPLSEFLAFLHTEVDAFPKNQWLLEVNAGIEADTGM